MIKLPEEVDGREISYHYQMDARGMVVLAMGAVTVILLFCLERQNEKGRGKEKTADDDGLSPDRQPAEPPCWEQA